MTQRPAPSSEPDGPHASRRPRRAARTAADPARLTGASRPEEAAPLFAGTAPEAPVPPRAVEGSTQHLSGGHSPVERVFVGWHRPGLEPAVDVLWERFANRQAQAWDLSHLMITVPARRAARQLLARLVARAEREGVALGLPARIVTPGLLLDALCPLSQSTPDALLRETLWADALRSWHLERSRNQPREEVGRGPGSASEALASDAPVPALMAPGRPRGGFVASPLLRHPPAPDDPVGWMRVAERVARVHTLLASHGLTYHTALGRIAQWPGGLPDSARWSALAEVEADYLNRLEEAGLVDRDHDILHQLGFDRPSPEHTSAGHPVPAKEAVTRANVGSAASDAVTTLVLVGLAELSPVLRAAISTFAGSVLAIVFAPTPAAGPPAVLGAPIPESYRALGDNPIPRQATAGNDIGVADTTRRVDHPQRSFTTATIARAMSVSLSGSEPTAAAASASGAAAAATEGSGAADLKESPPTPSTVQPTAEREATLLPSSAFDTFGSINPHYWRHAPVHLAPARLQVVDKPVDQADLALTLVADHANDRLCGHEVVIVAPDATLVPTLRRRAELAGVNLRDASGRAFSTTSLYRLLTALGSFIRDRSVISFMALIRHPEIERVLNRTLPPEHELENADQRAVPDIAPKPDRAAAEAVRAEMDDIFGGEAVAAIEPQPSDASQGDENSFEWAARLSEREEEGPSDAPESAREDGPAWWLEWVDEWACRRRPGPLPVNPDDWPGLEMGVVADDTPGVPTLRAIARTLTNLLGPLAATDEQMPLDERAEQLADVLIEVYEHRTWARHIPAHAELIDACGRVHHTLCELMALARTARERRSPAGGVLSESLLQVTGAELIELVQMLLEQDRIALLPDPDAIEAIGWLEVPTDDAELVIVTGVNEQILPEAIHPDPILPDRLRQFLGTSSSETRFARDVFLMNQLLHSRPGVHVIAGRIARGGEPLRPSRLLFNGPADQVLARLDRVLNRTPDPADARTAGMTTDAADAPRAPRLLRPSWRSGSTSGGGTGFVAMPRPSEVRPLRVMSVTSFRSYLASPYHFLLTHVLRLQEGGALEQELDALEFGSLVHELLREFAESDVATSSREEAVYTYLSDRLDDCIRDLFGDDPPAAILVQAEQMRARFEGFALVQARRVREGWRIVEAEWPPEQGRRFAFPVDGEPFDLTGRIDRIDMHPELGWCLMDYKTGNTVDNPNRTHRRSDAWVDLQLPLYTHLAREIPGLDPGAVSTCYFALPAAYGRSDILDPAWTNEQIADAHECARDVIRRIRRNEFFDLGDAPPHEGTFAALCGTPFIGAGFGSEGNEQPGNT